MGLKHYYVFGLTAFFISLLFVASTQSIVKNHFHQNPLTISSNIIFSTSYGEITLNGSVTVMNGDLLEFTNKTIYYNSSDSPIFTVFGELKLTNCKIIPLKDPVDFIEANYGSITLKNVTMLNLQSRNNSLFSIEGSYVYIDGATFIGFHEGRIYNSDNVFISNMKVNLTGSLEFFNDRNLTIVNCEVNLIGNNQVRLLDISSVNGASIINNSIIIPAEAVEQHGPWLEGISLNGASNVIVEGNEVVNGGKTLVSYGSSNVLIVNNKFINEKIVEGTELQIDAASRDIMIVNNSLQGFWEAIEIYSNDNITVTGNLITRSHIGIKVEPKVASELTNVYAANNIITDSNFFIVKSNGLKVEKNFIENSSIYIIDSNNVVLQKNILKNALIAVENSKNIQIVNNTVYVNQKKWLDVDSVSTVIVENNTIITQQGNWMGGWEFPLNIVTMMIIVTVVIVGLVIILILKRR